MRPGLFARGMQWLKAVAPRPIRGSSRRRLARRTSPCIAMMRLLRSGAMPAVLNCATSFAASRLCMRCSRPVATGWSWAMPTSRSRPRRARLKPGPAPMTIPSAVSMASGRAIVAASATMCRRSLKRWGWSNWNAIRAIIGSGRSSSWEHRCALQPPIDYIFTKS